MKTPKKKCPFCGGKPKIREGSFGQTYDIYCPKYRIYCPKCGCERVATREYTVIKMWDTRKG